MNQKFSFEPSLDLPLGPLPGGMVIIPVTDLGQLHNEVERIPFGDQFIVVLDGGLVHDILRFLGLNRIDGKAQLAGLTGWCALDGQNKPFPPGPHTLLHTRWHHSVGVAALQAATRMRLGHSEAAINLGILQALVHDAGMPAYGDATKTAARLNKEQAEAMDEDRNVTQIFVRAASGFKLLCERYGFPGDTPTIVENAVRFEKGVDGQLHNLCDSLGYMASDLTQIVRYVKNAGCCSCFARILEHDWRVALSIWQTAQVFSGTLVLDADALREFLYLRVLLWKNFYTNPAHLVLEGVLREICLPHLFKSGRLTIDQALTSPDRHVRELIYALWGHMPDPRELPHGITLTLATAPPSYRLFPTREEARAYEQQLADEGYLTCCFLSAQKINPKTHAYYVVHNGEPKPFCEAHRYAAAALAHEAADVPSGGAVAAFRLRTDYPSSFIEAWQAARVHW